MLYIRLAIIAGILALLSTLGYLGYSHVKGIGYEEAEVKYLKIIQEQNDKVAVKIDGIEKLSNTLVVASKNSQVKFSSDIKGILAEIQGKPLYYLKDGQCTPTVEFSDSLRKVIQRSNQEIKDSQK